MISLQEVDQRSRGILLALNPDAPDYQAIHRDVQALLKAVNDSAQELKPVEGLLSLTETLFATETLQHGKTLLAEPLAYSVISPSGGLESACRVLENRVRSKGLKSIGLPTDGTIRNHVKRFEPAPGETTSILKLMDERLWRHMDALYWIIFKVACRRLNITDGNFVVAIDGTSFPFYGKVFRKKIDGKSYVVGFATASGAVSTIETRNKGETGVPKEAGTVNGHKYLAMTAYHYGTKLVFPISVRFTGKITLSTTGAVKKFLNILKALPRPRFILADREFGNIELGQAFEGFHKNTGCHYLIPIARQNPSNDADPMRRSSQQIGAHLRTSSFLVEGASIRGLRCATTRWSWKSDKANLKRHWLLIWYFPKKEAPIGADPSQFEEIDDDTYMAMFITDAEPTLANAVELFETYRIRWHAIENTFRDVKRYFTYLPGKEPLTRFLSFGLAMGGMGLHSLDRRQRKLAWGVKKDNHPDLSMVQYQTFVMDAIKDRVLGRASPE
jgi:hypothetical protein